MTINLRLQVRHLKLKLYVALALSLLGTYSLHCSLFVHHAHNCAHFRLGMWLENWFQRYSDCGCWCRCGDDAADPPSRDSPALLTLFTSVRVSRADRARTGRLLQNWGSLRPALRPVLFLTGKEGSSLRAAAVNHGWTLHRAPVKHHRLPVLRDMFLHAAKLKVKTAFYGYANSDNLFDRTLIDTLSSLLRDGNFRSSSALIVGRRTNVNESSIVGDLTDSPLVCAAHEQGTLFVDNAQDYFITPAKGFPWKRVPPFVIGRVGFDNWLVSTALSADDVMVIDATLTLHDVHQTGNDGNFAGFQAAADTCYNLHLAGEFDYAPGRTTCAQWYTTRSLAGCVHLKQRRFIPDDCKRDESPGLSGA